MNNNLVLSEDQKCIVERQFISFLKKTIFGIRMDFQKSEKNIKNNEVLFPSFQQFQNGAFYTTCDFISFDLNDLKSVLNEKQKLVFDFVILQGKTEKETSLLLNMSQQGVNSIKKQIIEILKEKLEAEDYE